MRCFACSSTTHLLRDCPESKRPAELKVEFDSVFDIDERVRALNNFAIFHTLDGVCNEHSLRRVVEEQFWRYGWRGNVIPISNSYFLVGFVNEYSRDQAVAGGRMDFRDFSGIFYAWEEDLGTSKISRPVFVWLKLVGLPLQCWGEDEINKLVSPFGKLLQISDNFYLKSSADVVRVLVEVEDISDVPKVVQCTYKAISDDLHRTFDVALVPSCQCLPCSQVDQENYNHLEQGGGLTETVDDSLSNGSSVGRGGLIRAVRRMVAENEPPEVTDMRHAFRQEPSVGNFPGIQNPRQMHGPGPHLSPAELDRLRKGKGPMGTHSQESNWAENVIGAHQSRPASPAESLGAASVVGPVHGPVSGPQAQENVQGQKISSQCELVKAVANLEGRIEGVRLVGEEMQGDGNRRTSSGNSSSVPPGFKRISKSKSRNVSGPASPFGRFQKGGFKHLKRPASSTSSGKSTGSVKKKKGSPLSLGKHTASA